MDFSGFIETFLSYAQDHTMIVIVLVLAFLYLLYRKPKLFFGILLIGLFLAVLSYLITSMAGSGSQQKRKLIQEEKQSDSDR